MKRIALIGIIILIIQSCSKDESPSPDQTAQVNISAVNNVVSEPSSNGKFTLTLTSSVNTETTIHYTLGGTATNGTDYQSLSNSTTILANTTSVDIPISVLDDTTQEETETISITLNSTNNSNVTIGNSNSATISILDNTEAFVLQPEDTASYMVNPNSTPETIALFYNLKILSKSKFIIGQQDAFSSFYNNNAGDSDIKKTTGSDPGLLGSDFMFITDDNNDGNASNWFYQQEQMIKDDVVEAYNKGMVNVFCWHFREPYSGEEFYAQNIDPTDLANAFASILPGGENHDYYKEKLEKVAEVANSLVGGDGNLIPIIFRPFHEFDGHWFWWGADYCSPQQFKSLWQFTVEYLRDDLDVNNMLFAFSPDNSYFTEAEYLMRYPGDNYVDIVGMDNYGDFNNQGQAGIDDANAKLQIISNLAKEKVKIAGFTETGYRIVPGTNNPIAGFYSNNMYNAITNNENEIGFMMFWYNNQDGYYTPTSGLSDANDFIEFANKEKSVLLNELPEMYELPN